MSPPDPVGQTTRSSAGGSAAWVGGVRTEPVSRGQRFPRRLTPLMALRIPPVLGERAAETSQARAPAELTERVTSQTTVAPRAVGMWGSPRQLHPQD